MDIALQFMLGFGGIVVLGLVALVAIGAALMWRKGRQMNDLT